jgi:hypothetical protein
MLSPKNLFLSSGFNYLFHMIYILTLYLAFFTLFSSCSSRNSVSAAGYALTERVPAFPGAMGGGMYATGGRGGKVIKVTNLNDAGPGSFREAIESEGARTLVFDVSGNIELQSQLIVSHGDLTIAGHSAPGDGICVKNHEFRINADNVIIRYMRFRPGDVAGREYDAMTGMGNRNIIIDHCSLSWSTDETASFYDNINFTMQWCIISESLNNSVHSKGVHGYGGIWGGKDASFLYNILAHHNSRNPRLQGTRYQSEENLEKAELINNIVYNWGNKAIYGGEQGRYNLISNIFIPGPASTNHEEIMEIYEPAGLFYLSGNVFANKNGFQDAGKQNVSLPRKNQKFPASEKPFTFENAVTIYDPESAYLKILAVAGASLRRDAVDLRIIEEIAERKYSYGSAGIIDSQNDVGGWPVLRSDAPLPDSDGDGIPDAWEIEHGLDPHDPSDAVLFTLHPQYTNIEIYHNQIITRTLINQKQ